MICVRQEQEFPEKLCSSGRFPADLLHSHSKPIKYKYIDNISARKFHFSVCDKIQRSDRKEVSLESFKMLGPANGITRIFRAT